MDQPKADVAGIPPPVSLPSEQLKPPTPQAHHPHQLQPQSQQQPTPSCTLYVRNLPDKLPKQRLRRLLHAKFSAHGRVVYIVAEKTMKLRGQAFITFEHQSGATAALRSLQNDEFMGKRMMIAYAKQITHRTNTALPRSKRKQVEQQHPLDTNQENLQGGGGSVDEEQPMESIEKVVQPNKILFVQNLSSLKNVNDLQDLFVKYAGFVEVRSVPGNHDIAFVEYNSEHDAAIAMAGLHQSLVGDPARPMIVNFAKK